MSADHILETRALTKEFKGFVAVNKVDLKVRRGQNRPEFSATGRHGTPLEV